MLLEEERTGEVQAREALFLTFNVDLAFFETRVLGTCLAAGARVSVIADGNVWNPDVRAVRHAGRSYNVGLVASSAAFHPKVVILAGTKRVQIAIGSGNLTLGGWQYNDEVWLRFNADGVSHPAVLHEICNWLRDLSVSTWLDEESCKASARTWRLIQRLMEQGYPIDTGHKFVTSAHSSIIDELPTEHTSELRLHAPFLDGEMAAVSALHERFSPTSSTLLLQPGLTILNPSTLEGFAKSSGMSVEAQLPQERSRYRHGKVIWWDGNAEPRCLMGSPNLSSAALLRTWRKGGNYETAVIGPAGDLTVPAGTSIDAESFIPGVTSSAKSELSVGTMITSARIVEGDLVVSFSHIVPEGVDLEISHFSHELDHWEYQESVPAGEREFRVSLTVAAVSRVRIRQSIDGGIFFGPCVFVMNPSQIEAAPKRAASPVKSYSSPTSKDIWQEGDRALEHLSKDFDQLKEVLKSSSKSSASAGLQVASTKAIENVVGEFGRESPWLWDLEAATRVHGPSMTAFILGLPEGPRTTASVVEPVWADVLVDDNEAALDEDSDDQIEEVTSRDDLTRLDTLDHRGSAEAVKRRRQRRCAEWVENIWDQPPFVQLAVLRIVTCLFSAGNWKNSDPVPLRLIAAIIDQLAKSKIPEEIYAPAASMVLVSCAVLREAADLQTTSESTLIYREAIKDAAGFVGGVDLELVAEYCKYLIGRDRNTLRADHITDLIENDLSDNPLKDVQAAVDRAGWDLTNQGLDRILVSGSFSNPELAAIQVTGWLGSDDCPPIWAVNSHGKWSLCIWRRPNLIVVDCRGTKPIWKHFLLSSHMSPAAFAQQRRMDDSYSAGKQRISRPLAPFPEALEALNHWHMAAPHPPRELMPKKFLP
ncbi:hypothetical protein LRQ04_07535 [Paenarthrobacter sp. AR 02]|uniref:hypothetical protein n=1 Tax=Paenarthrobacter sp. AR 02 TaxID=2899821 RepID=UPI001F3A49F1|nr:hypothetical protein [Paenarthrobacter sp. AR 02]MCF3139107.1 hypothetical protein [Paenarthrobacter sp. AR 02]